MSQQASLTPSPSQRIRPGRRLYLVAVLVVAFGALLVGLVSRDVVSGFSNAIRVTAPGASEIMLAEAGTYTISYEHQTVGDAGGGVDTNGQPISPPPIPNQVSSMQLKLVSAASANTVTIRPVYPEVSTTYVGTTEDDAIAEFSIDRPGKHSLVSRYQNGQSRPQVVLAIARGSPDTGFIGALGMFAGIVLLIVGLGVGIVTLILRMRSKGRPRVAASQPPAQEHRLPAEEERMSAKGPAWLPGGQPATQENQLPAKEERVWSMLSHLSVFVAPIIAPLIIMLTLGKRTPYVRHHGVEALNFQITFMIVYIAGFFVDPIVLSRLGPVALILFALQFVLAVWITVLAIIAASRSYRGQLYRYPLTPRFVR